MDYYNSDGSWETFCANGARCAVKLLYKRNKIDKQSTFISGDGSHEAIIENNIISIKMQTPKFVSKKINIENYSGYVIDSGALHYCINIDKINLLDDLESIGRKIRNSDIFKPRGVNVNFFNNNNNNILDVCTYEKGVEKLMLSCGSGSLASAFYANKLFKLSNSIQCISKGGELKVSFDRNWKNVWIAGDTVILYESSINLNHFK